MFKSRKSDVCTPLSETKPFELVSLGNLQIHTHSEEGGAYYALLGNLSSLVTVQACHHK